MNIDVSDTKAGGSVYIAGMSIAVKNTQAEGNMFSAASDVTVDNKTTCNGAYFTGQTVQFDGKAKALNISAESASFNGNVHGDVTIDGENVGAKKANAILNAARSQGKLYEGKVYGRQKDVIEDRKILHHVHLLEDESHLIQTDLS